MESFIESTIMVVFLEIMIKNKDFDVLEQVVAEAHEICSQIMLFEAIEMEESEVRFFLDCHHISDHYTQNAYLELVRQYDEETSSRKSKKIRRAA
jgi:hypothetical protein